MKAYLFCIAAVCILQLTTARIYGQATPKPEPARPAAPAPGAVFQPGPRQMFQPVAMDPALVRQSMQARSEYDDLNRRILARQTALYEENARIKELQTQLRDMQKQIDKLMAEDKELTELKQKLSDITPEIPMGARKGPAANTAPFSTIR